MLGLTITYASGHPPITVSVPDMGLSPRDWAAAAFAATNCPGAADGFTEPGAGEVDMAIYNNLKAQADARPIGTGDRVHVAGHVVRCVGVTESAGGDLVRKAYPTFAEAEPVPVPSGPFMHVSAYVAPPDAVAYVEDRRDRLWTGRGLGEWRCLTDPAGRTAAGQWAVVWRDHGPLTPLVPVERLDEPDSAPAAAAER